jgi:hypothetical protein
MTTANPRAAFFDAEAAAPWAAPRQVAVTPAWDSATASTTGAPPASSRVLSSTVMSG